MGRTSWQQELYAQSDAAVCSVSSAKQFNEGNACHVLCVSVVPWHRSGVLLGSCRVSPGKPRPGIRRVSLSPALHAASAFVLRHLSVVVQTEGGRFQGLQRLPGSTRAQNMPFCTELACSLELLFENPTHKHKAKFSLGA